MNSRPELRKSAALISAGVAALALGLAVTWLDGKWIAAGLVGLIAVALVAKDYRIGVVCLTVLLPWAYSTLLPQTYGFNLINFLMLASVASLAVQRGFGASAVVNLPSVVRWCYLLPVAIGVIVAWPHLSQGATNFPSTLPGEPSSYAPANYLKALIVKPLFFVLFAFLLANAVRDSKNPSRLFIPFAVSSLLPAIAIIFDVVLTGEVVSERGTFLAGLGMHSNEYGMQLALAAGPLLFLAAGTASKWVRLMTGAAFAVVSLALLMTGSRGAASAYAVLLAVWLLHRRRFSDLLWALALAIMLAVVTPESIIDRLTLGLDDVGATTTRNEDDPLTKGRVSSWALLAPEILDSPVWGQGTGSTAWNAATNAGRYAAAHPHNLYLEILLDLGVAGFVALMYLYYRYARAFRLLSKAPDVPPIVQDFFRGAFASLLGVATMALTNGHWMPHPEQTFLWFSLGFAFAYWGQAESDSIQVKRRQRFLGGQRLGGPFPRREI